MPLHSDKLPVQYQLLGVIAACLTIGGVFLSLYAGPQGLPTVLVRAGVLCGAIWLAWPTFQQGAPRGWAAVATVFGLLTLLIVLVRTPISGRWLIPLAGGVLLAVMVLRPRKRRT